MNYNLWKLRYRLLLLSLTGKLRGNTSSGESNNENKVLIIFPIDETLFRVASYSFRNLKKKNLDFVFMVKDNFISSFKNPRGKLIQFSIPKNTQYISISDAGNKEIINTHFKMIIDLNTQFIFPISMLINSLFSTQKIGFKSEFSDKFYNIQLDINRSGISERGYSQIKSMLLS